MEIDWGRNPAGWYDCHAGHVQNKRKWMSLRWWIWSWSATAPNLGRYPWNGNSPTTTHPRFSPNNILHLQRTNNRNIQEREIVDILEFDMFVPTPYSFMRRFLKAPKFYNNVSLYFTLYLYIHGSWTLLAYSCMNKSIVWVTWVLPCSESSAGAPVFLHHLAERRRLCDDEVKDVDVCCGCNIHCPVHHQRFQVLE
jgi:hypothetical protein